MAENEITTLPTQIPTSLNITALARKFRVNRRTIQRRLKRGWTPSPTPPGRTKHRTQHIDITSCQTPRLLLHPAPQVVPQVAPHLPHVAMPHPAPEEMPHPQRHGLLRILTLAVAIALATVVAYFSITGMVLLFPGAVMAVIFMAATMEAGKLVGTAWLARHWRATGCLLRATLTALIVTLAVINAVGVYGRLTAAHLTPHAAAAAATEQEASTLSARIEAQAHTVADLDRRISQIDSAVEEAAKRGRGKSAMSLAEGQHRNRNALVAQRQKEATSLVNLKADQAQVQAESRRVEADIGPLQYAATLLGLDREQAIRLLILMMVLTCDPMAIVLVIAASRKE
jgi:hypothetical protein